MEKELEQRWRYDTSRNGFMIIYECYLIVTVSYPLCTILYRYAHPNCKLGTLRSELDFFLSFAESLVSMSSDFCFERIWPLSADCQYLVVYRSGHGQFGALVCQ